MMPRMTGTSAVQARLRGDIERSGYYPALVTDALETALGGEEVLAYVVHHEATFDPRDELRRHVTVLALTPPRLIVEHTDEHPAGRVQPAAPTPPRRPRRSASSGSTRWSSPAWSPSRPRHRSGGPLRELVLTIGWGAVSRIDLEPATCGDPECDADHGYTGTASNDDLSLRVSEAADGAPVVEQALAFAAALSEATADRLR